MRLSAVLLGEREEGREANHKCLPLKNLLILPLGHLAKITSRDQFHMCAQ